MIMHLPMAWMNEHVILQVQEPMGCRHTEGKSNINTHTLYVHRRRLQARHQTHREPTSSRALSNAELRKGPWRRMRLLWALHLRRKSRPKRRGLLQVSEYVLDYGAVAWFGLPATPQNAPNFICEPSPLRSLGSPRPLTPKDP